MNGTKIKSNQELTTINRHKKRFAKINKLNIEKPGTESSSNDNKTSKLIIKMINLKMMKMT